MKYLVVVNEKKDWPLDDSMITVVQANDYLQQTLYAKERHVRILNFCRSYRYQTVGYYVSLLAEARGHKPIPSIQTITDLKSQTMVKFLSDELNALIQSSLKHLKGKFFELSIFFGKNMVASYDKLAQHIYAHLESPAIKVYFHKQKEQWAIKAIETIHPIPKQHLPFFQKRLSIFFHPRTSTKAKKKGGRYDLAILYNPLDKTSDEKAIQKFIKAGEHIGFSVDLISKNDFDKLSSYDALFIREGTSVNHHTFRFARRAEALGMVVIDDPESILKCSNKVYLNELFQRFKIPTPKTCMITQDNIEEVEKKFDFPFVLKQPDSSFSRGVKKIENKQQLYEEVGELLEKSELLIAQEFISTPFDWRVTLFNKTPLFVCKYYMSRRHWQVCENTKTGKVYEGRCETLPVGTAPKKVVSLALRAASLIGDGFYGVDIKEKDQNYYVIEVNDNPSIEFGFEDKILNDELYQKIMQGLMLRVESLKQWNRN